MTDSMTDSTTSTAPGALGARSRRPGAPVLAKNRRVHERLPHNRNRGIKIAQHAEVIAAFLWGPKTIVEAAEYVGCERSTIERWIPELRASGVIYIHSYAPKQVSAKGKPVGGLQPARWAVSSKPFAEPDEPAPKPKRARIRRKLPAVAPAPEPAPAPVGVRVPTLADLTPAQMPELGMPIVFRGRMAGAGQGEREGERESEKSA